MAYDFQLVCDLPSSPAAVYAAWLDSEAHSAMTGAPAAIVPVVGAEYSAWDGYIHGRTLELVPDRRIVQTWRTSEFADDDPDSTIVVEFEPIDTGTRLTLFHRSVPDGQTAYEERGWREFYFEPMNAYFGRKRANGRRSR